jgi:imidazolonepropionase-like amidohydrolase
VPKAPLAIILAIAMASAAAGQSVPIAIVHARIIDGRGGSVISDGSIVIRGEKIEAVGAGPAVSIPTGAQLIDGAGRTVIPGLADMHVHLIGGWDGETTDMLSYRRYLNALLYAGVTTVLDTGNVEPYILQIRQEVAASRLPGPRIYCAGALIDGPDPFWPEISFSVVSAKQVPALVGKQKAAGVDVIKAYAGLSVPIVSQLAAEGKKAGLRVFIDQHQRNGSMDLMNAGIAAFAHLPTYVLTPEAIELAKAKRISFITTPSVYESHSGRRLRQLDFLRQGLIAETTPPWFLDDLRALANRPVTKDEESQRAYSFRGLQAAEENATKLWKAGLLLAAGTDAPYPGDFQGEGIHHELELLVEAGLTPLEAITAATRNAALLMNATDWGTLAPGMIADLVIVNGRPDQRIADTHKVETVIQRGVVLNRQLLKFDATHDSGFRVVH